MKSIVQKIVTPLDEVLSGPEIASQVNMRLVAGQGLGQKLKFSPEIREFIFEIFCWKKYKNRPFESGESYSWKICRNFSASWARVKRGSPTNSYINSILVRIYTSAIGIKNIISFNNSLRQKFLALLYTPVVWRLEEAISCCTMISAQNQN